MKPRPWTTAERTLVRLLYPDKPTAEIAEQINRTVASVYSQAHALGLSKSAEFYAGDQSGRCEGTRGAGSRFRKGIVPANKGLRRPGWSPGRMAETQFKKGRPPSTARNYAAIGSHRYSKDGYLERKVSDDQRIAPARRWTAVHRLVWEAEHGPIPAGHAVVFLPGRRTRALKKITLDALELVSRAELMRRNSAMRYGIEIQQTMSALGRLKKAIERKTA